MSNAFGVEHTVISKKEKKIKGSVERVNTAGGLLPGKTFTQTRKSKGAAFRYDPKEKGKTNAAVGAGVGAAAGAANGYLIGSQLAQAKNISAEDKLRNLRIEELMDGLKRGINGNDRLEYERQRREWMSNKSSSIPKEYSRAHKAYKLAERASTPGEKEAAKQAFSRMAEKHGGEQKLRDVFVKAESKPKAKEEFKFDPYKNDPKMQAKKAARAAEASSIRDHMLRTNKKFTRNSIIAGAVIGGATIGASNYFGGKKQRSKYNQWAENLHPRGQGGKFANK